MEKILYLRRKYHLGHLRISWYLKRYHGISVSSGGVWNVLKRNGMNRLPRNTRKRTVTTHRYEKQVPGHHIQVDVKALRESFKPEQIKKGTMHHANKAFERYFQVELEDSRRIYKGTQGGKKMGKVFSLSHQDK